MPWPREEVINTTVRLRASQFNSADDRGQPVPYFIRHAREIDPGLIDRQIVHYGNYDPFMEFDIQMTRSSLLWAIARFILKRISLAT